MREGLVKEGFVKQGLPAKVHDSVRFSNISAKRNIFKQGSLFSPAMITERRSESMPMRVSSEPNLRERALHKNTSLFKTIESSRKGYESKLDSKFESRLDDKLMSKELRQRFKSLPALTTELMR